LWPRMVLTSPSSVRIFWPRSLSATGLCTHLARALGTTAGPE
jgi:hypothetical protein